MKGVELYAQVRYAVQIEGISRREAVRRFGIAPRTVAKMLAVSVPPGYATSPASDLGHVAIMARAHERYDGCRAEFGPSAVATRLPCAL
jgi:hypothetical protein